MATGGENQNKKGMALGPPASGWEKDFKWDNGISALCG